MEKQSNSYHISFFKPTTPQARSNRNMVLWLVSIWFLAIFGFQIVLRIIEKPVAESSYISFQNAWDNIQNNSENKSDLQELSTSVLSVLGKIDIPLESRSYLDKTLSWAIYHLHPDSQKSLFIDQVILFENQKDTITKLSDPLYLATKQTLSEELGKLVGLSPLDVRTKILPLELISFNIKNLDVNTIEQLPVIMEKYLIHNQSFLTDIKILGFPFHYFYTAIFLLILFVGLCLIYCIRTDTMNHKMNHAT